MSVAGTTENPGLDEAGVQGLRVLVVGLGPMGRGIARSFAGAGARVSVLDVDRETTQHRLTLTMQEGAEEGPEPDLAAADSLAVALRDTDLLIEAIAERPQLKAELLAEVAAHAPAHLVVASNTSSLSIGELGVAYGTPQRLLGLHFFNPVARMRLVEVVAGPHTEPAVIDAAAGWVRALGKTPVVCRDSPNFVVNRICRPLYYEAQLLVTQGVDPAVVDTVARGALGHRMGPLELLDFAGLHTHLGSSETALREFGDPRYRPIPLARALVRAGATGRAAGRGFYDYAQRPPKVARGEVLREPGAVIKASIAVTGPGARQLLTHPAIADRAAPLAAVTIYSAPSSCTAKDVAAIRELVVLGTQVFVDSSHPGWLTALPDGVGWIRLHTTTDRPFAEVVVDDAAAIEAAPFTDRLLDAIGASSVRVPALPGLVADRLQYPLIGEAVTVVEEDTATAEAVDLALELGMNHPRGPFKVLAERGEQTVLDGLRAMADAFGDPRYRPAPLLVRRAAGAQRRKTRQLESSLRLPI